MVLHNSGIHSIRIHVKTYHKNSVSFCDVFCFKILLKMLINSTAYKKYQILYNVNVFEEIEPE